MQDTPKCTKIFVMEWNTRFIVCKYLVSSHCSTFMSTGFTSIILQVVHQESEQALLKSSQFYFEEIDCAVKVLRPVIMYTVKF